MLIVAVSDAGAVAYGLALLALVGVPATVTLLKGHVVAFVVGLFTLGLVWVVASLRLARPGSWWARRFYRPAKLERVRRRYGE